MQPLLATGLFLVCSVTLLPAQTASAALDLRGSTASPGSLLDCSVTARDLQEGQVFVLLGFAPGSTLMSNGGQTFSVPLGGPLAIVASGTLLADRWDGKAAVPAIQSLVGLDAWFATVVMEPNFGVRVSESVPFGPIIEDSLQ